MNFELRPLCAEHTTQFKKDMQEAFQLGAVEGFGEMEEILPESHIDRSLSAKGAIAYEAFADGAPVGGAIVVINEETRHNHLDFFCEARNAKPGDRTENLVGNRTTASGNLGVGNLHPVF